LSIVGAGTGVEEEDRSGLERNGPGERCWKVRRGDEPFTEELGFRVLLEGEDEGDAGVEWWWWWLNRSDLGGGPNRKEEG